MNSEIEKYKNKLNDAKNKLTKVSDWLRFMVSSFGEHQLTFGHGTTNAYDEAVYLTLHTLNLPLDNLEPFLDATLLSDEIDKLAKVCELRVIEKLPSPYITNLAILCGYEFYVDKRVIVPRSFIASLILNGQLDEQVGHVELVHNVLDLCTGNGSLSIIAADYFYDSCVIASDIDLPAIEVANKNIADYMLGDRIEVIQSDLFNNLSDKQGMFDLILTNPPYVDKVHMDELTQEFLHEPQIALFGGDDGLVLVDRILRQAANYLTPHGVLVMEMGDNRVEFEQQYPDLNVNWFDLDNGGMVFYVLYNELERYFLSNAV